MNKYRVVNHWQGRGGTSLQGYVHASFAQLQSLLGDPMPETDGYKVSTEWVLVGPNDEPVTLYDYKETDLYSRDLPSVEEFRTQSSYEWHIGAGDALIAKRFELWLVEQLNQPSPIIVETEVER